MPISRLATESRPSQAQCSSWQLATAVERSGRSGPPSCGGTPPATPPLVLPPCLRDSSSPSTPPCVRGSRSSNHESRVTAVMAVPALPRAGDSPRNAPPCYATVRARPQLAAATERARRPQFESRITNHESRQLWPFRPSLVRGDSPRNAPLCYAAVPARPQPAANAQRTQCHHLGASPANRDFDRPHRLLQFLATGP